MFTITNNIQNKYTYRLINESINPRNIKLYENAQTSIFTYFFIFYVRGSFNVTENRPLLQQNSNFSAKYFLMC